MRENVTGFGQFLEIGRGRQMVVQQRHVLGRQRIEGDQHYIGLFLRYTRRGMTRRQRVKPPPSDAARQKDCQHHEKGRQDGFRGSIILLESQKGFVAAQAHNDQCGDRNSGQQRGVQPVRRWTAGQDTGPAVAEDHQGQYVGTRSRRGSFNYTPTDQKMEHYGKDRNHDGFGQKNRSGKQQALRERIQGLQEIAPRMPTFRQHHRAGDQHGGNGY